MLKNVNSKYFKSINKKALLDFMYLFILALYFTRIFFDTTMFSLPWPARYFDFMRLSIGAYLVFKVALKGYKNINECLIEITYLTVFIMIFRGTGYWFLLELGFLVLEAKDISYKKILGLYFFIGSSIMIITIFGSLTGTIKDLIYIDDGMYKHAFGIVYTTDFGAHIFFLVLAYLAYRDKSSGFILNAILFFIAIILYLYSGTRNTSGSLLLLILGNLYIVYTDKVIIKNNNGVRKFENVKLRVIRYIDYCLILSVPILAFLSIYATIVYSSDNIVLSIINSVTSGRLNLGQSAIKKYGMSLWGAPFDMIGAGGNTVWRSDYNFVDNSYVMIFIRYGVILLLLTTVACVWIAIKAYKAKKRFLLVILCAIAIQCTIEHHLLEIAYNPFILLVFSKMDYSIIFNSMTSSKERKRASIVYVLIIATVIFFTFMYTDMFAFGRTLVTLLNLSDANRSIYFVFGAFFCLGVIAFTLISIEKILYYLIIFKEKKKICLWANIIVLEFLLLLVVSRVSIKYMERKKIDYALTIDRGYDVIDLLAKREKYKLYIDDIPYFYMIDKEKNNNIIPGNPSRNSKDKTVVITDISKEMIHLIRSGYTCGRLSETEYIYTNDSNIAESIREFGIEMNNYYGERINVNLFDIAYANGLSLDSKGRIVINGRGNSLIHGPWATIYEGRLKVDFDMTLTNMDNIEGKVATLRLSSGSGAKILKEITINRPDFDEKGNLIASLVEDIPSSEGVEFLIFAEKNVIIQLNSLSYRKVKKD